MPRASRWWIFLIWYLFRRQNVSPERRSAIVSYLDARAHSCVLCSLRLCLSLSSFAPSSLVACTEPSFLFAFIHFRYSDFLFSFFDGCPCRHIKRCFGRCQRNGNISILRSVAAFHVIFVSLSSWKWHGVLPETERTASESTKLPIRAPCALFSLFVGMDFN